MTFRIWLSRLGLVLAWVSGMARPATAQDATVPPSGSVSGRVISRETRAGIPSARVEVMGTGRTAVTGESGNFVIRDVPVGVYAVRFSAIGYQPYTQSNVPLGSGKPYTVLVELSRQPVQLQALDVTAAPYFQPALEAPAMAQVLTTEEVRRAPGVQEDVIRAVALLPGVGVTTGGRNDLVVRGGAPFENLFLVDGIEVPNLNHFGSQGSTGGPVSLIDIDFVRNAEFSTGGFGVPYGDRTASVTSINLREANRDRVSGEVNLSATGVGASIETPLAGGGSVLASLRRSYLDLVFSLVDFPFRPTYYDATVKAVQPLGPSDRLSFLFIGALDDIALDNSTADNRYDNSRVLATNQNQYLAGLTWERSLGNGHLEVALGRTFSLFESSQQDSLQRPIFLNRSKEGVTSLRGQVTVGLTERLDLRVGQDVRAMGPMEYRILLPGEYRRDASGVPRPLSVDTSFTNLRSASWVETVLRLSGRFRLTTGLRGDFYGDLRDAFRISPRALLAYAPAAGTTVSLGAGRYYQSPSTIWLVGDSSNPGTLEPFHADQVTAGLERLLRPDSRVQVEAYYKSYSGYPARVFRPQAVLSLAGFEDVQNDIPFGLEPLASSGTGHAYGLELSAQKRLSDLPLYGLASVSLNRTEFRGLDRESRPGSFDTRLITTLLAGYRFNPRWELSGKFRLATGRPTTPFVSSGPDAGQLDFSQYNAGPRLPLFHALDLRVDRRWTLQGLQLDTYVDIPNVYGRHNVSEYRWDSRTGTVEPGESIGVLPTIGVNIEF
ncbi:MAG: hypothetical protein H6R40_122 [Gemmatimonadetes bacterium]|nr:hypothetical protein [Gemmatimonadota bacterium]